MPQHIHSPAGDLEFQTNKTLQLFSFDAPLSSRFPEGLVTIEVFELYCILEGARASTCLCVEVNAVE